MIDLAAEAPSGALAPLNEHQVLVLLVQIALLVGAARLLGAGMRRLGQPAVVGELLAGVLLGPSLFGVLLPEVQAWIFASEPVVNSATFAVAWLGVVLLLVVLGYETDLAIVARFRRVALVVAAGSLAAPLVVTGALGFGLSEELIGSANPPRWVFAAFFALALSVSALPVVGKILADLGFLRRNFGQITLAAAMAKDAVGWLVLAVLAGVAADGVELGRIAVSFGGLALFALSILTVGRRLLDAVFRFVLARGSDVAAGLSITLVVALIGAAVTQALSVEAILGAYLVGLTLSTLRHQLPAVRERLEVATSAFFAPVFFAVSGLRVDITALGDPSTAVWAVTAIVLAVGSNFFGTVVAGRLVGVHLREALALGSGLSALGVMGVVVAIIGLNAGVIDDTAYTILVLAAVTTSLLAPVFLRWAVAGWSPPSEEAHRLERESLRDEAEILGAGRILLPTRGGANSLYAARLVAAAFEEAEVTVLVIDIPASPDRWWRRRWAAGGVSDPDEVVAVLGHSSARVVRRLASDPASAIAEESRLGYDVVVMGASNGASDGFAATSSVVERVLAQSQIPTVIVHLPRSAPGALPDSILVPVTATRSSRAAEELGYTLAAASGARAGSLHVVNRPDGAGIYLPGGSIQEARDTASDLLSRAAQFGSRLGVEVMTEVLVAPNAEQEILDFARDGRFEMVVLGASNRSVTNRPFFGHRVNYIVEHSDLPVVVVALPSFAGHV